MFRKKRKIKEIKDKAPESIEVRTSSPPTLEIFSKVAELAKEIVEEGNTQFSSLIGKSVIGENAQKDKEASPPKEDMNIEKAIEVFEGIPQAGDKNSVHQDQRVEENTEKDTHNVDEDTQEVVELLASNMSIEEDVQDEHMEFSTGIDLNIEDINTDFYSEVFQDGQGTSQYVQETTEAQNDKISTTQKVEVSAAEPGVQNVQDTEPVQIYKAVEVVEIAPTTEEV